MLRAVTFPSWEGVPIQYRSLYSWESCLPNLFPLFLGSVTGRVGPCPVVLWAGKKIGSQSGTPYSCTVQRWISWFLFSCQSLVNHRERRIVIFLQGAKVCVNFRGEFKSLLWAISDRESWWSKSCWLVVQILLPGGPNLVGWTNTVWLSRYWVNLGGVA